MIVENIENALFWILKEPQQTERKVFPKVLRLVNNNSVDPPVCYFSRRRKSERQVTFEVCFIRIENLASLTKLLQLNA